MTSTACEIAWLLALLKDFSIVLTWPTTLYCDNHYAYHIVINRIFYQEIKHIAIKYYVHYKNLQYWKQKFRNGTRFVSNWNGLETKTCLVFNLEKKN